EFSPVPTDVEAVTIVHFVTRASSGVSARCAAVKAPEVMTRNSLIAGRSVADVRAGRELRPAFEAPDLRLDVVRHRRAIGCQHHHLEALVEVALREFGAHGVYA